jgi:diguanylate cyclase (GGDEF)-like protein/PAS domain S-box-containing protein
MTKEMFHGPTSLGSPPEEHFSELVENADLLVQSLSLDGRFIFADRKWGGPLGYKPEEIAGLRLEDVVRPDHREVCTNIRRRLEEGEEVATVETAFVTRTGRSVEVTGLVMLWRDAQGRPQTTRGFFRDVTEEQARQARIAELLETTRTILSHAPIGIGLYDADGPCRAANVALARIVGGTVEQVEGLNFRQLEAWRRHGLLDRAEACLASGEAVDWETWGVTTFGVRVCLRCRFVPLRTEGRSQLLVFVEDITRDRVREETLIRNQKRLTELHETVGALVGPAERDSPPQRIIDSARRLLDAEIAVIVCLDPDTGRPGRAYSSNYPLERIPPGTQVQGRGVLGRIASGETVHSRDVTGEPDFIGWPEWHPQVGPLLGLPVREGDRCSALMLLGRPRGALEFSDDDLMMARTMANLAGVALRVARQWDDLQEANKRLKEIASTDSLTGLANRRAFDEELAMMHATAKRYEVPYGMLLIDIDHFKLYNDRYGHPAGDRVLRKVAELIQRSVRKVDRVFRYGGEELVVLLPHQRRTGTAVVAERLRRCVEEAGLEHAENAKGVVTVSIGGAVHDPGDPEGRERSEGEVLQAADDALYRAKGAGRNRFAMDGRAEVSTAA